MAIGWIDKEKLDGLSEYPMTNHKNRFKENNARYPEIYNLDYILKAHCRHIPENENGSSLKAYLFEL